MNFQKVNLLNSHFLFTVEMLKKNIEADNDEIGKLRFNTYRRLKGMLYVVSEELPGK